VRGVVTSQGRIFGYRPDPLSKRVQKLASRAFGASPLPDTASLAHFRCPILDQGPTSSCGGHGSAQGIHVSVNSAASTDETIHPLLWTPSPDGIYKDTRVFERQPAADGTLPPLQDSGIVPADLMRAVTIFGIRPIRAPAPDGRYSDVSPENVNLEPDFADTEASIETLVLGEYRIDEKAIDVIDVVCDVIAHGGRAVGIGIFVDTRFQDWRPGAPFPSSIDTTDTNGGGHWITIDGYITGANGNLGETNNGKRIFEIVNSWGTSAGDGGIYRVTEDWVRQASDLYVWSAALKQGAGA